MSIFVLLTIIVYTVLLLFYHMCVLIFHPQAGARGEGYNSEDED